MYEYYHSEEERAIPSEEFRQQFGQQFLPPFGQFQPPFGPPSGTPGASPGTSAGAPPGPPPSFTPQQTQALGLLAVDPGAIRPCTNRFVFIWLNTGERFWAWLNFVGRRSAAGWRWTGFRWIYFGVDLRNIQSFVCF
ncbi:MAG TPA: hypothetical protein PLH43_05055 [Acetivibrio sp.]|uniref:hypothetical protein n=1 Tax=Acetivibrio sp. TaxID=1872092 RepID=UPI002D128123|nr:hypothetical protein [Acetivibrio sp.]HOM02179.1 hypothetical protein [Acetivibrio sp.]